MEISNPHNLVDPNADREKRFGIRVSIAQSDPFRRLLPERWERFHWYADAATRDHALADMISRHRYSRIGDKPTMRCEPVER
jgi:hypothetical protein